MWPITNNLYKKLWSMRSGSICFDHIWLNQIIVDKTLFKFVFLLLSVLFAKETSSFSRNCQMLQKYFPHIVKLRKRWNVRNDIANSPVWPSSMKTSNNLRALHGDLKLLLLAYTTNHQIKPFAHLFPWIFFLAHKAIISHIKWANPQICTG